MDAFVESKGDKVMVKRGKEAEKFRFGHGFKTSKVYESKENYEIEVEVGKLKEKINVSVVDADIPLLLGRDYQVKWGLDINIQRKEIFIGKSVESFNISRRRTKHWPLPIQKKQLHQQIKNLVYNVDLELLSDHQLRKHITKLHQNLCHKSYEQMVKLFSLAGKGDRRTKKMAVDVVARCSICNKFKIDARDRI